MDLATDLLELRPTTTPTAIAEQIFVLPLDDISFGSHKLINLLGRPDESYLASTLPVLDERPQ